MDFLKHIVTVASALLAILVSLEKPPYHNNLLFYALLLSLLLSILFGTSALYIVLVQHRRMGKDLVESVQEQIRQNKENYKPVFSKQNKLLSICEVVCIVSFLVSVISLVGYAVII
jgi:hypothetical protein